MSKGKHPRDMYF